MIPMGELEQKHLKLIVVIVESGCGPDKPTVQQLLTWTMHSSVMDFNCIEYFDL